MGNTTKLTDMHLSSVDLVRRGANLGADIRLFKGDSLHLPAEGTGGKALFRRIMNWLNDTEDTICIVEKEPPKLIARKKDISKYTDALAQSIQSIVEDRSLDWMKKRRLMRESLDQCAVAMDNLCDDLCGCEPDELFDEIEDARNS